VAAAQEAVKEQLAAAAENIEVPPVEIPSNTEEVIRQCQLQA
jgi:energy-coupling factor transporter ATP-binding protein EcfA2